MKRLRFRHAMMFGSVMGLGLLFVLNLVTYWVPGIGKLHWSTNIFGLLVTLLLVGEVSLIVKETKRGYHAGVPQFLEAHPFLVELIGEVRVKAQEFFPGSEFVLELSRYGKEMLWANIVTDLAVDEALARLRKLDYEWWLDQLDRTQDLFGINVRPG